MDVNINDEVNNNKKHVPLFVSMNESSHELQIVLVCQHIRSLSQRSEIRQCIQQRSERLEVRNIIALIGYIRFQFTVRHCHLSLYYFNISINYPLTYRE